MSEQQSCDRIEPQLPDWLSGRLDPVAALAVAQHLNQCHRCRAAVAEWSWFEAVLAAHFASDPIAATAGLTARITTAIAASPRSFSARRLALWLTGIAAILTLALMVLAVVGAGPGIRPDAVDLTVQYWSTLAVQGTLLVNDLIHVAPLLVLTLSWSLAGLALATALATAETRRYTETPAPRGGL